MQQSSPHANWSVAPLVPRKSPERRRLVQGHKASQSLNLPRSTFLDFRVLGHSQEASVKPDNTPTPNTATANDSTPTTKAEETVQTTPVLSSSEPQILSPRPRRLTDVHALETAQLLVESSKTQLQPAAEIKESEPAALDRLSRPQGLFGNILPAQRHVRNARSLSPTRHERMQSLPCNETSRNSSPISLYLHEGKRISPLHTSPNAANRVRPSSRLVPERLDHQAVPLVAPEEKSISPNRLQSHKRDSSSFTSAFQLPVKCLTDEQSESSLRRAKDSGFATPDEELIWAADVLRLRERRGARLRSLNDSQTPSLDCLQELLEITLATVAQLSSQGIGRAMFLQGTILEFGRGGVKADRAEAFSLYKQASRAGFARADYRLGTQFERIGDMATAYKCFERGAGRDDSACLYRMGIAMLVEHNRYPADEVKGINCIHLSALSADSDAPQGAYLWALLLAGETLFPVSDRAVQCENQKAVKFFEKAACLGSVPAQLRLGKAHEFNELGCDFSPILSWHYYSIAAQGNEPEGDMALSKWLLAGSDDGLIQQDEGRSFYHAELAAGRGLPSAEFAMGYYYEVGIACEADLQRAQEYYRRAAEHGSLEAKSRIAGLARHKTLSRQDHEMHVSTRIHARHATIRQNQKQVAARRRRADSTSPQLASPMPKAEPTFTGLPCKAEHCVSEDAPSVASDKVVQDLMIAPKPMSKSPLGTRQTLADHLPTMPSSEQVRYRTNSGAALANNTEVKDAPQESQFVSEAIYTRNETTTTHASDMLPVNNNLINKEFANLTLRDDHVNLEHGRIQKWNESNATQSLHGSPNLAPSELSSVQGDFMLNCPRPESSVSNIPPFRVQSLAEQQLPHAKSSSVHHSVPGSIASSSHTRPSSQTSFSQVSSKRGGAATFEEMGIPLANKKKEECIVM